MWRPTAIALSLALQTLLCASLGLAQTEARWLSSSTESTSPRLLLAGDRVVLESEKTKAVFKVPQGTQLDEIVETQGGWLAAGTVERDEGREIVIYSGLGREVSELPVPGRRNKAIRSQPTLLVGNGELRGIVWLEGVNDMSFRLEFAEWKEGRWRHHNRITGRGPGSQLALDAVVLGDGSWLAVWSRFDRKDDEIYWSRHQSGQWSEPRRVSADNQVPDIVPSLVARGGEAWLAWSRFDEGEYRLMMARYSDDGWSDERFIAPGGSLFPSWHATPEGADLVYRQAMPSAWVWMEMDVSGQVLRTATAEGESNLRPIPSFLKGGSEFLFPDGRSEAASWTAFP